MAHRPRGCDRLPPRHAVKGWCPPVPLFRRLGVRTCGEIERERYALKALRGDFDGSSGDGRRDADSLLAGIDR